MRLTPPATRRDFLEAISRPGNAIPVRPAELAPGRPLRVVLHHEDGSEEAFAVSHTLNDEQIRWFRAGSALNLLRTGA